jgi:elongation factor P
MDDDGFVVMNQETYDQFTIPLELIDNGKFLKEGDTVDVMFHAEKETLISVELPASVVLAITYTEPGMRGDTATNTLKAATLETGAEVRVPLFCEQGDLIKIDTVTGAYMERVKK